MHNRWKLLQPVHVSSNSMQPVNALKAYTILQQLQLMHTSHQLQHQAATGNARRAVRSMQDSGRICRLSDSLYCGNRSQLVLKCLCSYMSVCLKSRHCLGQACFAELQVLDLEGHIDPSSDMIFILCTLVHDELIMCHYRCLVA